MDEESLRQAKVWAAKLGMSYSDFAGHAIASECINRDLIERDVLAHFPAKKAAKGKSRARAVQGKVKP
jgi:hypothetical protein